MKFILGHGMHMIGVTIEEEWDWYDRIIGYSFNIWLYKLRIGIYLGKQEEE